MKMDSFTQNYYHNNMFAGEMRPAGDLRLHWTHIVLAAQSTDTTALLHSDSASICVHLPINLPHAERNNWQTACSFSASLYLVVRLLCILTFPSRQDIIMGTSVACKL